MRHRRRVPVRASGSQLWQPKMGRLETSSNPRLDAPISERSGVPRLLCVAGPQRADVVRGGHAVPLAVGVFMVMGGSVFACRRGWHDSIGV